jgi:multidrug resistance efflux pump
VISSRVSGVAGVYVKNNSVVKKGDCSTSWMPRRLTTRWKPRKSLAQARLTNQQQVRRLRQPKRTSKPHSLPRKMTKCLTAISVWAMQNVSQSDLDKVRTTWQSSVQAVNNLNDSRPDD